MLFVAFSILPCLVILFYRHPLILLCLFPFVQLANVFLPDFMLGVGAVMVIPADAVYFFTIIHLCVIALRRPRRMVAVLKENIFLTMLIVVVATSVVLFTPMYGQSAIGEARKYYFMFLIPLLAPLVINKPEDLRTFIRVVVIAAACVAVGAVASAATRGSVVRAVNAEGALTITIAAFSIVIFRVYKMVVIHPILDRFLSFLFSAIPIAVGHRSVWLAIGMGVILILWLYRRRIIVLARWFFVAVLVLVGLSAAIAIFPRAGSALIAKFGGILDPSSDDTASWRMEGWQQQLDNLRDTGRLLYGEGVGSYYRWEFRGSKLGYSPHNAYVQLVLKFGLFGLSIYILSALRLFYTAAVLRKRLRPGPLKAYTDMGIVNFGAAHAYCLGYGFEPIMMIFFAVAMGVVQLSRKAGFRYREPLKQEGLGDQIEVGAYAAGRAC
jgi:O-antigen ligase